MDEHNDGQTVNRSGQSTQLGEALINEQGHFTECMCCMQKSKISDGTWKDKNIHTPNGAC